MRKPSEAGLELARIFRDSGTTQAEFAGYLECSLRTLQRWMDGTTQKVPADVLARAKRFKKRSA